MSGRSGFALLEVVVGVTVFAIAALSASAWVRQTADAVARARADTAELRGASAYMERLALWPIADLDRHLGERRQGRWTVLVRRATATLYDVALADSTGQRIVLRTILYRPIYDDGPR